MGTSIKRRATIITLLSIVYLLLPLTANSANSLPTAEDINELAEITKLTADNFMKESFELRMRYEFSPKSLKQEDKENLHKLAKSASDRLQAITEQQKQFKQEIEDYHGDDWDLKYGSTGLWRKLNRDIYITNLAKCKIDYYLALTVEQSPLNKTLQDVRVQIISLDKAHSSANSQLLKAKILALARIDAAWSVLAIDILDSLLAQSNIPDAIYFRAAIEKNKLIDIGKAEFLNSLTQKIVKSNCADDLELILPLVFLQKRHDPNGLEKTIGLFPQTEGFLGKFILSDLHSRFSREQLTKESLQQISAFEAELAAEAAWRNKAQNFKALLEYLSSTEKFQTPLILYVAATAFAESSPTKAVNLLIEASKLQQEQKSNRLEIPACKIAEQAAQLAYNLFVTDANNCFLAYDVFRNYKKLANNQMDENLEYTYTELGFSCGDGIEAVSVLQKIAAGNSKYKQKASLSLAAYQVRTQGRNDINVRPKLLQQFADSIADSNDCIYIQEIAGFVKDTVENIELLQSQTEDFSDVIANARKIARFVYGCDKNNRNSLVLAEISTFFANQSDIEKELAEKIINQPGKQNTDIGLYRCRARLFQKRREFEKAAGLWAKICKIRKTEFHKANQRSWKWWRAKFYELACWAKLPQTKKENLVHTIEVLENSFQDIPPLWAKKLSSLKQQY
ncbi:MAG: hypothetical protein ACYS0I_02465 [Planctomycetota bacterium]|jgi:hypothetical protein